MAWLYFNEDWSVLHKCTFDGANRLIVIGPNTSEISVKVDIYSDWKEWTRIRDNAKYLPAIRSAGGDPIGGGEFTGDVYFLTNNWRIYVDHSCAIDGVIYSDDFPSPFVQADGTQIVTNKVSALVQTVATDGGGVGTVQQVKDAVWGTTNLAAYPSGSAGKKLDSLEPAEAAVDPWTADLSTYNTANTAGKVLRDGATAAAVAALPSASAIAGAVRVELQAELTHILQVPTSGALTPTQETMIIEMFALLGLDPTKPLIVTRTARTAGAGINQTITGDDNSTTVVRVA